MSIKLDKVGKRYGEQDALKSVSFVANKGEILGLLGPNGAGKSTSMKIISGFLPFDTGQVEVCGMDVVTNTLDVQKKIGYLPEHNPLYLDMYIKEYLDFVASIHKIKSKRSRIEDVISQTGLEKEQGKIIRSLSKGYRQRVGIAQAILHDPEVLILDEPISGLDPNQLVEIRSLIKSLAKEKTVILSTHIMQEVEAICDRLVVIDSGQIVADDMTENLLRSQTGKQLIKIQTSGVLNIEKLAKIAKGIKVESLRDNRYKIYSEDSEDIREKIFDFVVSEKVKLLSMTEQTQNIESLFQKLTN